jgi:hypothetical protein
MSKLTGYEGHAVTKGESFLVCRESVGDGVMTRLRTCQWVPEQSGHGVKLITHLSVDEVE